MSNLGIQILYDQVNRRADALAERAYAPWTDMESKMRAIGIPLYSLESKHALADFDLIGFTLPYETLYTNALNLLDLAGIPVRAEERGDSSPIIIAGGHACFNPEPMHAFIDAFVIGEGEEVLHEIIDTVRKFNVGKSQVESPTPSTFYLQHSTVDRFFSVLLFDPFLSRRPSALQRRPLCHPASTPAWRIFRGRILFFMSPLP